MWSPFYQTHISRIETIQHKLFIFAAFKLGMASPRLDHDYRQVATRLNLSSLRCYTDYFDILFLHNLINNNIDSAEIISKIPLAAPLWHLCTTTNMLFKIPFARTNSYYHAPLWKMCRKANSRYKPTKHISNQKYCKIPDTKWILLTKCNKHNSTIL